MNPFDCSLKTSVADQYVRETGDTLLRSSVKGESDDILKYIYHVSSKVKSDIKRCKGHTIYTGIDQEHVEGIVPQLLFLLSSLITGENNESANYSKIFTILVALESL